MDNSLTLNVGPKEAVFIAGSVLLMLQKTARKPSDEQDRFPQILGLTLLHKLQAVVEESGACCDEVQKIVDAALSSGLSITGELVLTENISGVHEYNNDTLLC